ncbi:hypothetical protein F5Y03DRAFT_179070 [Xylaria venustula]|nr:hypothetical protein F5Y03DRAFT_179070 [Xylaria venustula]
MRLSLALAALSFAITAEAQNFSSYVPECAPPCVEQTLNSTNLCTGLSNNKCLCTNFAPIILSSRICFVQSCNNPDIQEIRSEITTGWQKFCNDTGIPVNLTTDWDSTPSSFPFSWSTASSTITSISSTSSPTESNTAIPNTSSGSLSTGAKAGIGVGAGVGSLAVISGLVFLGFRLGRRRNRKSAVIGARSAPPVSEGTDPDRGQSAPISNTTDWATAEGGGDVWAYKPQTTIAELPSPSSPQQRTAELPGHEVRELQTHEPPVELWHGIMPPELSADAEIPRRVSPTRS